MARKRMDLDAPELELTALMNVVMLLIPALLFTMETIKFSAINVNAPRSAAAGGAGEDDSDKPKEEPLNLTVTITAKGFYVSATGGVLGGPPPEEGAAAQPTLPIEANGEYPYDALTKIMVDIKDKRPTETKIFINVDADIKYWVLARTMDATRETPDRSRMLFYDVALAQGFVQ